MNDDMRPLVIKAFEKALNRHEKLREIILTVQSLNDFTDLKWALQAVVRFVMF